MERDEDFVVDEEESEEREEEMSPRIEQTRQNQKQNKRTNIINLTSLTLTPSSDTAVSSSSSLPYPRRVVGDYYVLSRIGVGSFSVVWLGIHRQTGIEVAIKSIPRSNLSSHPKAAANIDSEISIMKKLSHPNPHPNLLPLIDLILTKRHIYLILEYCKGGDLAKYLRKKGGKLNPITIFNFATQIKNGIQELNKWELVHRDLVNKNNKNINIQTKTFINHLGSTDILTSYCSLVVFLLLISIETASPIQISSQ